MLIFIFLVRMLRNFFSTFYIIRNLIYIISYYKLFNNLRLKKVKDITEIYRNPM